MTDVWQRDAWELANSIRDRELSSIDVLEHFLARIDAFDADLNAFCFVDREGARKRAAAIDEQIAAGEDPGSLAGVPIGVKELVAVAGFPDTHASRLYQDDIATRDDTEAARLRDAGAVLVGLTTSPEFGSTNWTRSYLHGTTRNPWHIERTPGGSSGGSAAAVASGMMPICTGSDGGGSIRIPSSYSGLFGFKVSFGRVGSNGPFDNALMSVPGPICRSVRDAARYVDAIAGPTSSDPTSLPRPLRPYEDFVVSGDAPQSLRGKRVAWSATLGYATCDPEVEEIAYEAAIALTTDAGMELVDVDVTLPKASGAWGLLSSLSTSTHHGAAAVGRHPDITPVSRDGFEQIERLAPEQLLRALRRRDEVLAAIGSVFDSVDLLLTPTTATTAFVAEGPPPLEIGGQRVGGMGSVPYTAPFNVSGQPAVSIPAGLSAEGLPVGLQVVARRHEEELVLAAGLVAEQQRPWPKFAPLSYTSTLRP